MHYIDYPLILKNIIPWSSIIGKINVKNNELLKYVNKETSWTSFPCLVPTICWLCGYIRLLSQYFVSFFVHLLSGQWYFYIFHYVDDIILATSSNVIRQSIISKLGYEFGMKDFGPLSYFLCIFVTRHLGGLFLWQKKYAKEIIEQAGMSSCKPFSTPVDTSKTQCLFK